MLFNTEHDVLNYETCGYPMFKQTHILSIVPRPSQNSDQRKYGGHSRTLLFRSIIPVSEPWEENKYSQLTPNYVTNAIITYPLVNCSRTMEDHHQRNGHWDVGSPQVRRLESLGIFDLMGMTNDPLVLTWHSENHQNMAGLQVLTNMTWDKPPFFAKLIPFLSANRLPRHFLWLCLSLRLGSWVPFSKVFDALAIKKKAVVEQPKKWCNKQNWLVVSSHLKKNESQLGLFFPKKTVPLMY